jgi:hypothetical protein
MADARTRSDTPGPPAGKPASSDRGDRLRRWRDVVEERLAEARERGDFDNLNGAGRPLTVDVNPFAGDKALAYSLLKHNQVAPPEIERGKEIDADGARADALLASLRVRRDAVLRRTLGGAGAERHAYNLLRARTEVRYVEALRALKSKILSFNIVTPALMHRRTVDVGRLLAAFQDEFPPLAE